MALLQRAMWRKHGNRRDKTCAAVLNFREIFVFYYNEVVFIVISKTDLLARYRWLSLLSDKLA